MTEYNQLGPLALSIYNHKYNMDGKETWLNTCARVVVNVMGALGYDQQSTEVQELIKFMNDRKFLPAGRYLYAAGRPLKQCQNCLALKAEDSREGWAGLLWKAAMALMTGAGIGIEYSDIRAEGSLIRKTGGFASGPISLMCMLNEMARHIQQGGSRRCLPGDAPIVMGDYSIKNIKDIKPGDMVQTRFGARRVIATANQGVQPILKITTEKGFVRCSPNHKWLSNDSRRNKKWVCASQLGIMNKLYKNTSEIHTSIQKIEWDGEEETYDIQVEEVEEFIAYGFVSHNSAVWGGLVWSHPDIAKFIHIKNWNADILAIKEKDANYPAPLDITNISVRLNDAFFDDYAKGGGHSHSVFKDVVYQMCKTGEPGLSIDTGKDKEHILRNACTEYITDTDSDICNLGSINLARVKDEKEFTRLVELGSLFLYAGTFYSDTPYPDVDVVRSKHRNIGLGLMGIHEWQILNNLAYGQRNQQFDRYMSIYQQNIDMLKPYIKGTVVPRYGRALAPNGSIGILAETTTGIEPVYCVAYKRKYLKHNTWHYQYVIDPTAKRLIDRGVKPEEIEDAFSLSKDIERRIEFQAYMQSFVDMGISSTINLPRWGSEYNNDKTVLEFGKILMKYLKQLRGITTYPDGARSGQPLTPVRYATAVKTAGIEMTEGVTDVCDLRGGSCGG